MRVWICTVNIEGLNIHMICVAISNVAVSELTCFWCAERYQVAGRRQAVVVTGNHRTRVVGPRG